MGQRYNLADIQEQAYKLQLDMAEKRDQELRKIKNERKERA
jgi:hypothetical protein